MAGLGLKRATRRGLRMKARRKEKSAGTKRGLKRFTSVAVHVSAGPSEKAIDSNAA